MSDYRAPRVWHIAERYGRFYLDNQFGGFEGWHNTREAAVEAGRQYVARYGDVFKESA